MTFSETHIHTDEPGELYDINSYVLIRKDRPNGEGGGIAAYISHKYKEGKNWKRREDLENKEIETLWIEFMPTKSNSFLICVVYRPPVGSEYLHPSFSDIFIKQLSVCVNDGNKEVIVMGDL